MKIYTGSDQARELGPTVVAIGTFDGVHIGHQALLRRTVETARACGMPAVAVTFDRHPMEVVDPRRAPTLLTLLEDKQELLRALGLDALLILSFDERLRSLEPVRFVEAVLVQSLGARHVFVGEGFRFGRGGTGDTQSLEVCGRDWGFEVHVESLVVMAGEPVSSSRIRTAILAGDVEAAAALLGRNYTLRGTVEHGEGIGRKLGFATANLRVDPRLTIPSDGVYATVVGTPAGIRPGAFSIGTRPTFGGKRRVLEVHLLDFRGDLYGATLEVAFVRRLRGQVLYERVEDLMRQMRADVEATRRLVDVA